MGWVSDPQRKHPPDGDFLPGGSSDRPLLSSGCGSRTKRVLTAMHWGLFCFFAFVAGALLYLYMPVASMTNPPLNWGYPRTVAGFFHALTRGQYERIHPTTGVGTGLDMAVELCLCGTWGRSRCSSRDPSRSPTWSRAGGDAGHWHPRFDRAGLLAGSLGTGRHRRAAQVRRGAARGHGPQRAITRTCWS